MYHSAKEDVDIEIVPNHYWELQNFEFEDWNDFPVRFAQFVYDAIYSNSVIELGILRRDLLPQVIDVEYDAEEDLHEKLWALESVSSKDLWKYYYSKPTEPLEQKTGKSL